MSEKQSCSGRKWDGWRYWPCRKVGKHKHNGKFYCHQHLPSAVQERRAEREKRIDAEMERDRLRHETSKAVNRVAEAALKADIYYYDRNQEWVITANEAGHELIAARDDLRRLKGESEMRRASE